MKRLTTEEFIVKAREIHGDKYDYSKVNYINNKTPVDIICREHGVFGQTPHDHLYGHGCPKCQHNIKSTTEEFIEKAIKIHGNKYDYSKVEYINNHTKVKIICPIHGEFEQEPNNHLQGFGCSKCRYELLRNRNKGTEKFVEEAIKIHGDRYDYSKAIYKNTNTKIAIICREHGVFEQTPHLHLKGAGCPKCT